MAIQPPLGRASRFEVRAVGDTAFVIVGGDVDFTMNGSLSETEVTSKDDNGHRAYLPNHDDWTADLSMRFLDQDPGQELVWAMMFNKTRLEFRARFDEVSGHMQWTGMCFPTKLSPGAPLEDASKLDTTLRLSGVLRTSQT